VNCNGGARIARRQWAGCISPYSQAPLALKLQTRKSRRPCQNEPSDAAPSRGSALRADPRGAVEDDVTEAAVPCHTSEQHCGARTRRSGQVRSRSIGLDDNWRTPKSVVSPLFPFAIISTVDSGEEVVDDKVGHCAAEFLAGIFI
jgi:hypothetical protein